MDESKYEALRQAADQFIASCNDGNVRELLEYYEEIFREALAGHELNAMTVVSQKQACVTSNAVCSACKGSGRGGSFQGGENDGGQSAQWVEHECASCSGSGIAGAEVDRTPVGPCGMFPCPPAAYCDQPGCLNRPAGDEESQAKAPQVPCPVCGGEAVHAQDVLARTTIAPVADLIGNHRVWCDWCDRIVDTRCKDRDDAVSRGCPPKEEEGD